MSYSRAGFLFPPDHGVFMMVSRAFKHWDPEVFTQCCCYRGEREPDCAVSGRCAKTGKVLLNKNVLQMFT